MVFLVKILWKLGSILSENVRRKSKLASLFKRTVTLLLEKKHATRIYDCKLASLPKHKTKFCLVLSEPNQRKLYLTGMHEPNTSALLTQILKKGMSVVDVGAYVGYYTVIASLIVGNSGNVLSIEPAPNNFDQLSKTVEVNELLNVVLRQVALADEVGRKNLRLSTDPATHSIADAEANLGFFKGNRKQTGETVSVKCTTLDKLLQNEGIPRVDLVKVDVEGAELRVLKGMRKTLQEMDSLHIICDVHENKFTAFGYSVDEFYRFLVNYQLNIFLLRDNGLQKISHTNNKPPSDQYTIYGTKSNGSKNSES